MSDDNGAVHTERDGHVGLSRRPVERLHRIRTLMPPIAEDAAEVFDGGESVAVRGVVVVEDRVKLDGCSLKQKRQILTSIQKLG